MVTPQVLISDINSYKYTSELIKGDGLVKSIFVDHHVHLVKCIGFEIYSKLDIDDIWKKINNIKLIIGNDTIFKIDTYILKLITIIEKTDSSYIFYIDFDIFVPPIHKVCPYYYVQYDITLNNEDEINNINILFEYIYLNNRARYKLATTPCRYSIQQIQGNMLNFTGRTDIIMQVNFSSIIKGYLIIGDIDNLNEIELHINGSTYYKYNHELIKYIKRISHNTIYIPFNRLCDWKDRTYESYSGGLNHSTLKLVEIKCSFKKCVEELGLYAININTFHVERGWGQTINLVNDSKVNIIDTFN